MFLFTEHSTKIKIKLALVFKSPHIHAILNKHSNQNLRKKKPTWITHLLSDEQKYPKHTKKILQIISVFSLQVISDCLLIVK